MPKRKHDRGVAKSLLARRETLRLFLADGLSKQEIAIKMGCAVGTVHNRLNRAMEDLSSDAQWYADYGREMSTNRISRWMARLEKRATAGECKECGRSSASDADLANLAGKHKGYEQRLAGLWGLDEPASLVVATRAREGVDELSNLIRRVILDSLPIQEAARLLLAIEKAIRAYNGEVDVEVSEAEVARAIGPGADEQEEGKVN